MPKHPGRISKSFERCFQHAPKMSTNWSRVHSVAANHCENKNEGMPLKPIFGLSAMYGFTFNLTLAIKNMTRSAGNLKKMD